MIPRQFDVARKTEPISLTYYLVLLQDTRTIVCMGIVFHEPKSSSVDHTATDLAILLYWSYSVHCCRYLFAELQAVRTRRIPVDAHFPGMV